MTITAAFQLVRNQHHNSGRLALIIAYGTEVRAFLHSGFAKQISQRWPVILVARPTQSRVLAQVKDFRVFPAPTDAEARALTRFRSLANNAHRRHLERRGFQSWRQNIKEGGQGPRFPIRLMHCLFGRTSVGVRLAIGMERLAAARWGTATGWQQLFWENQIQCVVSTVYGSALALPALQTASNMGLKMVVIMHSWKDVYTHPRIPVPLSRLGLWSERARRDLLTANPWFAPGRIEVTGSLPFEAFHRSENYLPRAELARALGLDPGRPFICYTTAAPSAVRNEAAVIAGLARAVSEGRLPRQPQLLLRVNPMDDSEVMDQFAGVPGVIVHRPAWEWDRRQDWQCAFASDVPIWVSTVRHAAMNVSIPSTVTLEFAVFGLPVVNVCYDLPSPLPPTQSNRRFWEAPHYEESRQQGLCVPAYSERELLDRISETLQQVQPAEPLQARGSEVRPVERAVALVEEALAV